MKKIFVFDEYLSSKQNGVGIFLNQFLKCLQTTEVEINVVYFNYDASRDFTIYEADGRKHFCFPMFARGDFYKYAHVYMSILKMYVSDDPENVFMLNHSPCEGLINAIKRTFPRSKRTFGIHDQGWTASLLGNRDILEKILKNDKTIPVKKEIRRFVKKFYAEECRMYRNVHAVICLSDEYKEFVEKRYGVPKEKLYAIPNGWEPEDNCIEVSRKELRKQLGIGEDERLIVFSGRLCQAKGLNVLLKAFEDLYRDDHTIKLVIIGKDPKKETYTQLTPNSISHIVYTGLIKREKVFDWYRIADIGILPTYTEQCSFTGIEMLAYGMLVVTSDAQGIREMFTDGKNAIIAPVGNTYNEEEFKNNLVVAIKKAFDMPYEQQQELRRQAVADAKEKYSLRNMAEGYSKLFDNLWSSRK